MGFSPKTLWVFFWVLPRCLHPGSKPNLEELGNNWSVKQKWNVVVLRTAGALIATASLGLISAASCMTLLCRKEVEVIVTTS